jgi:hypothetical protein
MVTFACLNLVEDVYPSLANNTNAMDLIFCRNVLMYFSGEQIRKVVANLRRSLVDGGRVGGERHRGLAGSVRRVCARRDSGITLYRRKRRHAGRGGPAAVASLAGAASQTGAAASHKPRPAQWHRRITSGGAAVGE